MKKIFFAVMLCASVFTFISCNNESKPEGTHTHEDGSTHGEHTDTTKPAQQEFNAADTTKKDTGVHKHADGEEHSH
jgi:uncharacterized lipoprotein NlpE involved in copper resistance